MTENLIIKEYNKEFEKYGAFDRRSLCTPKDKQDMRFGLLLDEDLKKSNMSILDYGCGFCDLRHFLTRNFYSMKYSGCDINDNFVQASKEKYQNDDIFLIKSVEDIKQNYDIICISGTFNSIFLESVEQMREYVYKHLLYLFEKSNYMLAINFLSHTTDDAYKQSGSMYHNPSDIYEFALENMTKRIKIDTAGLPYEATVKFYKNQKLDRDLVIYDDTI